MAKSTPSSSNFRPVYLKQQIRSIEISAKRHFPSQNLMQIAGLAAADLAGTLVPTGTSILIVAGPGDNGGDAFEAAYHLANRGYTVSLYSIGDTAKYSKDAANANQRARLANIDWIKDEHELLHRIATSGLIIDGLFGIGLDRPITGQTEKLIRLINSTSGVHNTLVLALDIPSGLDADTGQVLHDPDSDEQATAIRATHTITFIADKVGLHTAKGRDFAGKILLENLGIDMSEFPSSDIFLNTALNMAELLPKRQHDSNKGSYGDVSIVGGAVGMAGAPILGARTAIYCGAGRVHIGFCTDSEICPIPYDAMHPEIMCCNAVQLDMAQGVIAIGPGLGRGELAKKLLHVALLKAPALIIDADAINLIAENKDLQEHVKERSQRSQKTIFTPHPLEAARLLQVSASKIQEMRLDAALRLAHQFHAVFILKGSGSLISDGKTTYINTSGNPALATGGTGDVLAGVCAALMAQGLSTLDAARLACYSHGAAADNLVAQGIGPIGVNASELPAAIRAYLNRA